MKETPRQKSEEQFYDHMAATLKLKELEIKDNFSLGAQENRYAKNIFGDVSGKKILELGSGTGETAVYWALHGAKVDAIDVSTKMLTIGKKLAVSHKVSKNITFAQMAAENLKFKNESFDFIFASNVFHHVVHEKAIDEIHRVLKKGGIAFFFDPLAYNPIIEMYRKIAYETRTPNERPLKFSDIKKFNRKFSKVTHREFQLFTLLIFIYFYLFGRSDPNKDRYWKKITQVDGNLKKLLAILIKFDNVFLKIFPPLRYLCWNVVTVVKK